MKRSADKMVNCLPKNLCSWVLALFAIALESCANSVQILPYQPSTVQEAGLLGYGTAYVSADVSGLDGIDQQNATSLNKTVSSSIARALGSSFTQTRPVPDLSRVEPDSADLIVYVRAENLTPPKLWGDISRGWLRILLVGLLAEAYDIVALDIPVYRNNVILPVAALVLPLYSFYYCYQFEGTNGSYSLTYQLSILKPDGTLIKHQQFNDSAKVLVQADAQLRDLQVKEFIIATAAGVSGSIQRCVVANSASIRTLGEEMKRSYPADCDRILTFKRNIYRVMDDSASRFR